VLSKAALIVFLAAMLVPEDVGRFGLLTASLSLGMFLLGFDFYAYATRELVGANESDIPRMLRDQVLFHALAYVFILPVGLLLFVGDVIPWRLAGFFYLLLLAEHVAQELQRVLIALGRSTAAAVVLLLRGGVWVWVLVGVAIGWVGARTLPTVLTLWILGSMTAVAYGGAKLRHLEWRAAARRPVDRMWIWAGVKTAAPFLLGTLAIRGILAADRYALAVVAGPALVGVYSLYFGAYSAVHGLVEASVHHVLRPRIVGAYQRSSHNEYRFLLRRYATWSMVGAIALGGAAVLLAPVVFGLLPDVIYRQHLPAFQILVVASWIHVAGAIPDVVLYCRRADRAIAGSAVLGLVAAIALNIALVPTLGIRGAALATAGGFSVLAASKTVLAARAVYQ
jgi:O-antigen/teichoic acid export membrane protein